MKLHPLMIAAALLAAPAAASAQAVNPPANMPSDTTPAASSAAQSGVPTSAAMPDASAPLGSSANPIPESSPTPARQAGNLTPNDPSVVTNGPVPDTAANRARFGKPMSHAGRETPAAGN